METSWTGWALSAALWPARQFYLHFVWNGATLPDACAHLTGVPSSWWSSEAARLAACADLVHRRFVGWSWGAAFAAYLFALAALGRYVAVTLWRLAAAHVF